jgi:hypothetical protein
MSRNQKSTIKTNPIERPFLEACGVVEGKSACIAYADELFDLYQIKQSLLDSVEKEVSAYEEAPGQYALPLEIVGGMEDSSKAFGIREGDLPTEPSKRAAVLQERIVAAATDIATGMQQYLEVPGTVVFDAKEKQHPGYGFYLEATTEEMSELRKHSVLVKQVLRPRTFREVIAKLERAGKTEEARRIYKIVSENAADVRNEMEDWFKKRTKLHITLVQKYLDKIIALGLPELNPEVLESEKDHDTSKWEDPEREPYVHVSWKYRQQDLGKKYEPPADTAQKMKEATYHHVKNNKHHPEYWDDTTTPDSINPKDREAKPDKPVDATKMPLDYVAAMVADWLAMSEEKGTSIGSWVSKNVNVRWKFTPEQVALIDKLVDQVKVE